MNHRRTHRIKDNLSCESPSNCIWFDTETTFTGSRETTLYHHLKFGYACYMRYSKEYGWYDEEWFRFTTVPSFWDWVITKCRRKTKLYLFCHNTSFDLPVLDVFRQLPRLGYLLKAAIIDAPPTILRYRTNTECELTCSGGNHSAACKQRRREARSIVILDTLNFFRMPLAELGKEIGLEKYTMPEDNDLTIDWETYGRRDVEIIRDACIKWFRFLRDSDFGSFAPTLASQSMRCFRHKYMRHDILIDCDPGALTLTREGYYGGRCETFYIGRTKGHFTLVDFNSMYPSVMAREQFPCKLTTYTRYADAGMLLGWLNTRSVCARVTINTSIPFAPMRYNSKLIFPTGTFECILSTPELRYAFTHADVVKVHECAVYERAPLFQHMMNDLYLMRLKFKEAGNHVYAFLVRKLINSFYGKWGQNGIKWSETEHIEELSSRRWVEINADTRVVRYFRQFGGLIQERGDTMESADSFPAIAAHVTAYARMVLWDAIQLAGRENVFYVDTDSLLVNSTGLENLAPLIDATSLGFLSIKGNYDDIEIFGCKDYVFGSKARTKGVRPKAIWLNRNTVEQERWSGLRGLLAAGILDTPSTQRVVKRLARNYDKGVLDSSGRVLPYLLGGGSILNGVGR